jgi:curved DNA-binding protein CbpA
MQKINTHYDNLKVARNAPPEVIRAAYKSLSQKYHPDRNSDNPDAVRIMAILNTSYEALSDKAKREEHDLWIAEQELLVTQNKPNQTPRQAREPRSATSIFTSHVLRHWVLYGIAIVVIWVSLTDKPYSPAPGPKPYTATPTPEVEAPPSGKYDDLLAEIDNKKSNFNLPKEFQAQDARPARDGYERPLLAPNGEAWPTGASYVRGYKKLNTKGLSSVTIDNNQNDSDVFVKLVSLEGAEAYPVRQFYIPAYSKFTVNKVSAGSYDVRYRDLSSGGLSRSESFNLEETQIAGGTQFSKYTMTLYKVRNGNMQTYGLSEAEF